MNLRPQDLPRLRDQLAAFARTDLAAQLRQLDIEEQRTDPEPVARAMQLAVDAISQAQMYYATPDMAALVQVAARSLTYVVLRPDDPPSRSGLIWYTQPIRAATEDGTTIHIVALSWHVHHQTIRVASYVERDTFPLLPGRLTRVGFPPVFPIGSWDSPIGLDGQPERIELPAVPYGAELLAAVQTTWLLMRQPLADITPAPLDRATRRYAKREGHQPPQVRVIALKTPVSATPTVGGHNHEWHHRWIVRGHWRNARVGVGREQTRPVWVTPHVKGPADAPLLGGEKVYRWSK